MSVARGAGAGAATVVLTDAPDADAVFAANDAYAIALLSAMRRADLLTAPGSPQPVAVVGLGDLEMGRLFAPALSTIRVHGVAIGRTAAELLAALPAADRPFRLPWTADRHSR